MLPTCPQPLRLPATSGNANVKGKEADALVVQMIDQGVDLLADADESKVRREPHAPVPRPIAPLLARC